MTATVVSTDIVCDTDIPEARQSFDEAVSAERAGDSELAEGLYRHALELDPEFCDAMDNLGLILRRQGRVDEAIDWYQKSLVLEPENLVALMNLGTAYTIQGKVDEAIETYDKVNELYPESGEGYYGLGVLYLEEKQFDKAIENLKEAEKRYRAIDSHYLPDAQLMLGMSYFSIDDCENTRAYLEPLYSEDSPEINYLLGVCDVTGEPKNFDRAREYLDRAEQLGVAIPDDIRKALDAAE